MKYLLTTILTLFTALSLFAITAKTDSSAFTLTDNIFEAIQEIDIISLNVHLAEGADINAVDNEGNTPLMLAAKVGNPRMVKIILAHQPDVNAKNNDGYTALMIASEQGQTFIVEQLLNNGAEKTAVNSEGLTAAQIALRFGQPQIYNILENIPSNPVSR